MLSLITFGLIYSLLAIAGVILIKMEMPTHTFQSLTDYFKFIFTLKVIAGFAIIGLSAIIQIKALSLWEFSRVIPITTAIYFALTGIVGILLFKENFTLYSMIGMVFIITGIVIMNWKVV